MADPVDYVNVTDLPPGIVLMIPNHILSVPGNGLSIPRTALPQLVAALVAEMSAEQVREVRLPVVAGLCGGTK